MAGLIPRPFLDDLLYRIDLVELIDSYVPLKKTGANYSACCPFHHEKTPSFNVVPKKQFYHCFGCGASGNAISFMMSYLNTGFVEAVENLAQKLGVEVPREGSDKPSVSKNLYELMDRVSKYYQLSLKQKGQAAIDYLKRRGLTGKVAHHFGMGYAPQGWHTLEAQFRSSKEDLILTGMLVKKEDGSVYDRYRDRVTFPIHDRNGRIVGFGGRALSDAQKPKYLNSPETPLFQKNRELYGLYQVLQANPKPDSIIIVEGYMDVLALAQFGIQNVVATLGTATNTYHLQILKKYTSNLVFCFDGDEAGRQAAWRALESVLPVLNDGVEASFCFLPEGQDPDSLIHEKGKEGFLNILQDALPLHVFFFATLEKGLDLSRLSGKSQLVNLARQHLTKMSDGPYYQLMIEALSRKTHIDSHRLTQMVQEGSEQASLVEGVTISRTPLRIAMALILQNPEVYVGLKPQLAHLVFDESLPQILCQLIKQMDEHPSANTASLVELWRDSPYFEAMTKLAVWDHKVPDKAIDQELQDTLVFLVKHAQEKKIAFLLEKSRNEGLTDKDRFELQTMLKQKHGNLTPSDPNLE